MDRLADGCARGADQCDDEAGVGADENAEISHAVQVVLAFVEITQMRSHARDHKDNFRNHVDVV